MDEKKKAGAPVTLTHEIIDQIYNYLLRGSYLDVAYKAAGIEKPTWYLWMKKARDPRTRKYTNTIYGELAKKVDEAIATGEIRDLDNIDAAAMGREGYEKPDWRASAWRLSHRSPDRWGDRQKLEHTGEGGGPIQTEAVELLTDQDLKERIKRLKEKAGIKE